MALICRSERLRAIAQERKFRQEKRGSVPVPQTDTGIRDEYSKARGLNLSKELGKLAPYLRYKECPLGRSEEGQPTV